MPEKSKFDNDVSILDLFPKDELQHLQDEFAEATGVASIITDTTGEPITAPSNFCRLCSDVIRKTEKGLANCYKSDAVIGRYNPSGPTIQQCMSGGLWDAGAAISLEGNHIANWLIGQVRDETQTEENILNYAREIQADETEAVLAFNEIPSMPRERFEKIANMLFTLANQLSEAAYRNLQQKQLLEQREALNENLSERNEELKAKEEALKSSNEELTASNEELQVNEEELRAAEEELRAANEELTASNEELQVAEEELRASNEDLRAKEEELKAANEELTASNEELQVAEEELRAANEDLCSLNDKLKDSEQKYKALSDLCQEGIVIHHKGLIIDCNRAFHEMLGYEAKELIGVNGVDLLFEGKAKKTVMENIQNEVTNPYRVETKKKDGSTLWIEITSRNGKYNNQSVRVTSFVDMTEKMHKDKLIKESREKYKTVADFTYDWEYWMRPDGTLEYISPSCERITGYSREEFSADPSLIEKIVYAEDKEIYQTHLKEDKNLTSAQSNEISFRIKTKDGEIRWLAHICVAVFDEKGEYLGRRGSNRDITVVRKAQQDYKTLFSEMVEGFAVHEIICDDKGVPVDYRFIDVNPAFEILTGQKADDVKGKTVKEIFPDIEASWIDIYGEVALTGNPVVFENYSDVLKKHFNVTVFSPEKNRFACIFEDVTTQKKAALKLEKKNQEYESLNKELSQLNKELVVAKEGAEESDRLKTAFLANMSHEIRTPMNGILGFADLLKDPDITGEDQKTFVEMIESSGKRMLGLISDLVDISKIEAGHMRLNQNKFSVNKLLDETICFLKFESEVKKIQLTESKGLEDDECFIYADKDRLSQILINLGTNAFKFTEKGQIHFSYQRKGDFLEFCVRDTGIGIEEDKLSLIFERFRQIDNSYSRKHEGSGLGLSITKALVEMHGGNVWVESVVGQGSSFYFTIPYEDLSSHKHSTVAAADGVDISICKGKRILVAEDDDVCYSLVEHILKKEGVLVTRASDGQEAVDMADSINNIDMILMDIKLPKLSGMDAATIIKGKYPDVPIVAQTAFVHADDRHKFLEAGCDDYIFKPVDKAILLDIVFKYLGKSA